MYNVPGTMYEVNRHAEWLRNEAVSKRDGDLL